MRIAYVAAGAGGMYCGSCLHDNALASALIRLGHEVVLIPTYTPLRTDETDVSVDRVFFGAVNVYLQSRSAAFRRAPRFLLRWLDRPGLLEWVGRHGASTDARDLGPMTVSMLEGEAGAQKKELDRLVDWLRSFRPEIVHLTNSMFLGMARRLRAELDVPVVCSVQGEDIFLDQLGEPYRGRASELIRERARDVDGFVSTSRYYAELMRDYLAVPAERIHVVGMGLNLAGHGVARSASDEGPFVVGYLARVCPEKGLHLLVEAAGELARRRGAERLRVRAAGWVGRRDRAYLARVTARARELGLDSAFEFVGELDRPGKVAFLSGLHVLSVPTVYREPKGLYALEALANSTPFVEPAHGAFPELAEATGGGVLFEPGSAAALADALDELMSNPSRRAELGRRGREAVARGFTDTAVAERTLNVYESLRTMSGTREAR